MNKKIDKIQKTKKFLILASGTGTLFSSIVEACQNHQLDAQVIGLISDQTHSLVVQKAKKYNIPTQIFDPKTFSSLDEWDEQLNKYCKKKNPDLILMAGFLKKIGTQILSSFKNKILNIHPSLLPKYGGKGMYGIHVHQSVLKNNETKTGVSVHLASKDYDTGPVLEQIEVPISPTDTTETLQEKIKIVEKIFYISVLKKIIERKINLKKY